MSSSKKFKLMDSWEECPSQQPADTNWKLCIICQEETAESLTSPLQSKRKDVGQGYHLLAENLLKFDELGKLPRTLRLDRMDEGQGIEAAMVTNEAKWHEMCRLRYNNQMLQRTEKREHQSPERDSAPRKCSRLQSSHKPSEASCFFCSHAAGTDGLHEVTTFQVDQRVHESAKLTGDSLLLAKLSLGDMVALEAKYHTKCLLALYNSARKVQAVQQEGIEDDEIAGIVLAELVMYIEEARFEASTA